MDRLNNKPIVGITIGDPAGIGPEVVIKALEYKEIYDVCTPVVIGDLEVLHFTQEIVGHKSVRFIEAHDESLILNEPLNVPVFNVQKIKSPIEFGVSRPDYGKASFLYIKKAVNLALSGTIDVLVTAPINKISINLAGLKTVGHTEMLAELTNTEDPLTMFKLDNMNIFFLSRHVSLKKAIEMVQYKRVLDYTIRCIKNLEKLGITSTQEKPFAVAALNPHASDGGLFGTEEINEIKPAVDMAKELGFNVVGPVPADSVFFMARKGKFSGVLSLYHDQGHIAIKTVDLMRAVSMTLGLPFLRVSVDHGTGFDIAGKGIADCTSIKEAILVAAKYARKTR